MTTIVKKIKGSLNSEQMLTIKMKKLPLLIKCLFGVISPLILNGQSGSINYVEQDMCFTSGRMDSAVLCGTLSIPDNFKIDGHLIVLVTSSGPIDRNYFGFYKALADYMSSKAVATYRYDNYEFFSNYNKKQDVTSFDNQLYWGTAKKQAEGLRCAITELRKRYSKAKISILGHSEGAVSAAMASIKRSDISSIILLAPPAIDGAELSYLQFTKAVSKHLKEIEEHEKKLGVSTQSVEGLRNSLDFTYKDVRATIDIVKSNHNRDSTYYKLKEKRQKHYFSDKDKKLFGNQTLQELFKFDSIVWLNEHRVQYIKYDPEKLFLKINCPSLVLFGMEDERLNYRANMDSIKCYFERNKNANAKCKLIAFEGLGHGLKDIPDEAYKSETETTKTYISTSVLSAIYSWLLKPYTEPSHD